MRISALFRTGQARYQRVRPINIFLLRLLFLLVFLFVGFDAWSTLLRHEGAWDPVRAAAFCMWGAYALVSILGVLYPLRLLPMVLFEIIYKLVWLALVAYPLWQAGELWDSPAAEMSVAFLWVALPLIAMPWRYFVLVYVLNRIPTLMQSLE